MWLVRKVTRFLTVLCMARLSVSILNLSYWIDNFDTAPGPSTLLYFRIIAIVPGDCH